MMPEADLSQLVMADNGKPYLLGLPFHFSFSHCKGYAACAVDDQPVGIDIEMIHPRISKVAHKFLNDSEKAMIAGLDENDQLNQLAFLWAAKEAMYKMYEEELMKLMKTIDDELNSNSNIDSIIIECNHILKQMEIEARQIAIAEKKKGCLSKISEYKSTLMRKKEQGQRSQLIGDKSIVDRERMMNVQDKLNRQNDTILNAHKCVAETEEVGVNITKELVDNRTKIESAGNKSKEVNADLDSASKMLKSMQSRENCNIC
jgi:phosphopantetheine--protein transferase-like protein